ncbi:hypothetical protein HMPREF1548_00729 [Clostridium sp. KLE 1755]|nr:hypothetical protein HMPREF1548_00729 [Clostridium sp. KLE 1755]
MGHVLYSFCPLFISGDRAPSYQHVLCLLQPSFTANYIFTFVTVRQNGSLTVPA